MSTLDGAPPQLVRGLEIARRPRMRVESHLLSSRAQTNGGDAGARRNLSATGLLGSPPQLTVWMISGRNHSSRLWGAPGRREREQPTGDVAGLERPRKQGAQRRGGERSDALLSHRPRSRSPGRAQAAACGRTSGAPRCSPARPPRRPPAPSAPSGGRAGPRARSSGGALAHRTAASASSVARRAARSASSSRSSSAAICSEVRRPRNSHAIRISCETRRGLVWFRQLMSPHRRSRTMSEMLIEARTPHVRHVLEVNGRDAAQHRKAEVERTARVRAEGRNDARWLGAGIEDEPKPVLEIQLARLGRDVGGRIVQPEIRLERWFLRLGVDGAMPVLVESIEQDPLEPGHAPHLLERRRRRARQRDHALNPQQRRPKRVVHRDRWRRLGFGSSSRIAAPSWRWTIPSNCFPCAPICNGFMSYQRSSPSASRTSSTDAGSIIAESGRPRTSSTRNGR